MSNKTLASYNAIMYTIYNAIKLIPNHSKMRDKTLNITLEGTCNREVVGGLFTVDRGKPSGVFY